MLLLLLLCFYLIILEFKTTLYFGRLAWGHRPDALRPLRECQYFLLWRLSGIHLWVTTGNCPDLVTVQYIGTIVFGKLNWGYGMEFGLIGNWSHKHPMSNASSIHKFKRVRIPWYHNIFVAQTWCPCKYKKKN